MIGDLVAAEPGPTPGPDALLDSARPEKLRGALPTVQPDSDQVPRPDGYLLLDLFA
ncbi:hypothetical protein [Streptomyces kebangsaanensis]|uniref:hypothetical protein n=1 Tax=Streptomyces kebangsaanensis TaxID=864058 RepID=UPI000AE1FA81|nr:hypothetical protein [Streptomyces kebangsaanensis]